MKFSKRERFLMGLLIFVVIWVMAFRFMIVPGYRSLVQTSEDLRELGEEKDRMDLYLKQFPDLEEHLETLEEGKEKAFFYRDIDDSFMDRNLQEMAGRAGVEIVRMSIEESAPMEVKDGDEMPLKSGRMMETGIMMEVKCQGVEQVKEFARQVYQKSRSVLISYIDVKDESEAGSAGQSGERGDKGLKGMVEVRYYYEEAK